MVVYADRSLLMNIMVVFDKPTMIRWHCWLLGSSRNATLCSTMGIQTDSYTGQWCTQSLQYAFIFCCDEDGYTINLSQHSPSGKIQLDHLDPQ